MADFTPDFTATPTVDIPSPSKESVSSEGQSAGGSAPQDISDDTMVRVPGQTEPVRYGDLYKRLQADHTKKTQEASAARARYDEEHKTWAQQKSQEETYLKSLAAQLLQRQNGPAVDDPFSKLADAPYVDGKTAAALFKHIQENGIGTIAKAIQERDKVIEALYGQVMNLGKQFQGIGAANAQTNFEGKINKFVSESGLPAEAKDFAKELYLAYEGDDLDQEFPQILQNRWNQISKAISAQKAASVASARQGKFGLPGRGGNGAPSKGIGLSGKENAKQTADYLWESIQVANDSDDNT